MSFTAEVDGLGTFVATAHAAADELRDLTTVNADAAAVVARAAGSRVPRRTGRLAGSRVLTADDAGALVGYGAPYASFVNYGTRYMRARPFLTAALLENTADVTAVYAAALQHAADTVRS